MSDLKLYIAVREEVAPEMVPVLVAHTILNADDHFYYHEDLIVATWYMSWKQDSFKKVVVKVNEKEWKKIVEIPNVYLGHENTQMGGEKSCAVIPVMEEYPNVIKFSKVWRP